MLNDKFEEACESMGGELETLGVSERDVCVIDNDVKALVESINREFDAIRMYEDIADRTDNELVGKVMEHVADEEREHAKEFHSVLSKIWNEE